MSVETPKAAAYLKTLSKHFARKVEVEHNDGGSVVHFPMGKCHMEVQEQTLSFACLADNEQALEAMQGIIDVHLHRQIDLMNTSFSWTTHNAPHH